MILAVKDFRGTVLVGDGHVSNLHFLVSKKVLRDCDWLSSIDRAREHAGGSAKVGTIIGPDLKRVTKAIATGARTETKATGLFLRERSGLVAVLHGKRGFDFIDAAYLDLFFPEGAMFVNEERTCAFDSEGKEWTRAVMLMRDWGPTLEAALDLAGLRQKKGSPK